MWSISSTNLKKWDWIEQLVVWDEPVLKQIDVHFGKTLEAVSL